jgi:hypothetical protein
MAVTDTGRYRPILNELAQRYGQLTPERIVEEARQPSSPLHSYFEWDDKIAAERHRLNQARILLRTIVIVPVVAGHPTNTKPLSFEVRSVTTRVSNVDSESSRVTKPHFGRDNLPRAVIEVLSDAVIVIRRGLPDHPAMDEWVRRLKVAIAEHERRRAA